MDSAAEAPVCEKMDIITRNILLPKRLAFFCCDMQEKFRPAISDFGQIVEVASRLTKASSILNIPLVVTEQVI